MSFDALNFPTEIPMNCLIKNSLSFVMDSVVKRLIDDVNQYSYLLTTEDWQLLTNLDEAIDRNQTCENDCLGCLKYDLAMQIFHNFASRIRTANDQNKLIIEELCRIFSIPDNSDPISLALDLVFSPDYVKSKISEKLLASYDKYADEVKGTISRLAMDYSHREQAKHHDTILAHANLEQKQVMAYQPVELSNNKELFYVDQNFVSKYESDKNLSRQIENFKGRVACMFVYSPYLIEDGVKKSRVRLAEYFEAIEALTENTMLVQSGEGIMLATEDPQITFNRVLRWREATRAAEDLRIQVMQWNKLAYPHFKKGSTLSKRANENIDDFLESLRPHLDDINYALISHADDESDRTLCRKLSAVMVEKSFSLHALVNRPIKYESDAECIILIQHLSEFLDLINYETEPLSELRKIRSSLQDTEHLKHAWKTDYFVTDDNKLRKRGAFIYSALGLGTKFMSIKELRDKVAAEFEK